MLNWASLVVTATTSAILLIAGASKLARPTTLTSTLIGLGFPFHLARRVSLALPILEILVGLGIVLSPSVGTGLMVAVLGFAFASSGLFAVVTGRHLRCRCLSPDDHSPLGMRQLLLLPLWVISAIAVPLSSNILSSTESRLLLLALVLGICCISTLVRLAPMYVQMRTLRLAIGK